MPITETQVAGAARRAGLGDTAAVSILKRENDIALIRAGGGSYYLKSFTKPWYGDDVAATGGCVEHETHAWRSLAAAGLAVPDVVAAETGLHNPLERPYLITRALDGTPLTVLLAGADRATCEQLLCAVGAYLARMHAICYRFAGYLMPGGPSAPPDPHAWQHRSWTFEAFRRAAEATWRQDEQHVDAALMRDVRALAELHWATLAAEFEPPRFVHGDCHAHQFFVQQSANGWRVTGVLDMEVASAGDVGADWVKLALELPGHMRSEQRWWEPLFAGYGGEPAFDALRLRLLAATQTEYTCYGEYAWPGTRDDIMRRILEAGDWRALLMNPAGVAVRRSIH